ncbi:MAG: deoxyribonuclease IV [Succinivibrionaceae bacterium]|nr:deoxyribonuclease IV [Succinivibrionaceae bacterium]
MLRIGCHLSFTNGYAGMARDAIEIGANVFQFFTRNPRGGRAKPVDLDDIAEYNRIAAENGISPIVAHAPYTMNPSAADEGLREFAVNTMSDDLMRLNHIPGSLYNFHPGNHVKQGVEIASQKIIDLLNQLVRVDSQTVILLETMAGKGTEVGRTFEEIRFLIDGVEDSSRIGVCLDTCHVYDGGYDLKNNLDGVITEFDNIIGLNRLRAVHLNDSKFGLGSHKDRHAKIGEGELGLDAIVRIINHPALRNLPFYLETPNDLEGYKAEIRLLKDLYRD